MSESQAGKVDWKAVIFYYAIACAISWPFFYWRDYVRVDYQRWHMLIIMWGPGAAGFASLYVFRKSHRRQITLWGNSLWRSLLMWLLPLMAATLIFSMGHPAANKIISTMLQGATLGLLLTLGEELGWRGFLQDAVRPLRRWQRYAFIGLLWALWHFSNNFHDRTFFQVMAKLLFYIPMTIAISWAAGELADRTRSVLVACCVHAWVNISVEMVEAVGDRIYVAIPITLSIWWLIVRGWPRHPDTSRIFQTV